MENVQVYPFKERVELNDAMTKALFFTGIEYFKKMLMQGSKRHVIEKNKTKKKNKVTSSFSIANKNGYSNFAPLDEFARDVLNVCVSYWKAGVYNITLAMLLRGLTGNTSDTCNRICDNQRTALLQALDKLMFTSFDPDILEAFKELKIDGDVQIKKSAILPCYRIEKTVNGKRADVIVFDRESPLLTIAELKGHIIRYPVELLDVPNQNNTPLVITLKNYVMRRVVECIKHKMTPTLTLENIFKHCRINDASKRTKQQARETLDTFFAHLQRKGFIKSYEWRKNGNAFEAITFTPEKSKADSPESVENKSNDSNENTFPTPSPDSKKIDETISAEIVPETDSTTEKNGVKSTKKSAYGITVPCIWNYGTLHMELRYLAYGITVPCKL